MTTFDLLQCSFFFAYGGGGKGGPPDHVAPVVIGGAFLLLGAAALALGVWMRSVGVLGTGTFLSSFGYGLASKTLGWPGSFEAFQIAGWTAAAFAAFLPWLAWKAWWRPTVGVAPEDVWSTPEERLRKWLQPGERLLWIGGADARGFRGEAWSHVVAGVFLFGAGLGFGGVVVGLIQKHGVKPENLVGVVVLFEFLAALALLGFFMMLAPRLLPWRLKDVVYAVTDRRGLVWAPTYLLWNPVPMRMSEGGGPTDFFPWEMLGRRKVGRPFGGGDLVFATVPVPGSKRGEVIKYGFLGLPDLEAAEAAIDAAFQRTTEGSESKR